MTNERTAEPHDGVTLNARNRRALHGVPDCGERDLLQAILEAARDDLKRAAKRLTWQSTAAAHDAWTWLHDDDTTDWGSARMVCDALGLSVSAIRRLFPTPPAVIEKPPVRLLYCCHCHIRMAVATPHTCRHCDRIDKHRAAA